MFTWICPQCGREVPPSYDECPDCKNRAAAGPPAPPPSQQPPLPPGYPPPAYQPAPGPEYTAPHASPQQPPQYYQQPPQAPQPAPPYYQPQQPPPQGPNYYAPAPPQQPPQYYQPPQQQPAPPQYYQPQPPARNFLLNLPPWLMTIVFAVGIGGIIFGIYSLLQTGKTAGSGPTPAAVVESPAAKPGAKPNPLQKQIEISAVRFSLDAKKRTIVTFVITNHSAAEISGLSGNVTIWGSTKKSEEDAQGTFAFSDLNMAPFQMLERQAPLNSKLKIYELADWQNITTDVQITAPAG